MHAYMTSETSPDAPTTLLIATDTLTGLSMAYVVPQKGKGLYARAELKKFLYECGRTFGTLQ